MRGGRARREQSRFRDQAALLAQALRELRTARGFTQERLACSAAVAVSTIRKIEAGQVIEPGYFTVLALAGALGVELAALNGRQDIER